MGSIDCLVTVDSPFECCKWYELGIKEERVNNSKPSVMKYVEDQIYFQTEMFHSPNKD